MRKEITMAAIKGIRLGHAQNISGGTGCTVILCEHGAVAGVDVRGGGPATRETDLLNSVNMVEEIHGVMLSGGSAFGLDAASGAMYYLEEQGAGFDVGVGHVPIVCGAALFDLNVGSSNCRPDQEMGYAACKQSEKMNQETLAEGNVGAGTGATVGKFFGAERMMKSGLGIYGYQIGSLKVVAVVIVNALGDVFDEETGKQIAGLVSEDGQSLMRTEDALFDTYMEQKNLFSGNTTLGCIITNAKLTKPQANKVAAVAHNGYARVIRPVHTMADGDTIFVMATGEIEAMPDAVGALSTQVVAKAVNRAIYQAAPAYGLKACRDFLV